MQTIIFHTIDTILLAVLPALAGFIVAPVKRFIQTHHLETYAARAVRYAEQVLPDAEGEQKYRIASQYFAKLAAGAGIKVDPEDIKALLESAVNSLKTELAVYAGTPAQEAVPTAEQEAEPKSGTADEVSAAAQPSVQAVEKVVADDAKKVGDITIGELKKLIAK